MIWKIFFGIAFLSVFIICGLGANTENYTSTNLDAFVGFLFMFIMACVWGIFYSLGWKQQLLPKKSINKILAVFFPSIIILPITLAAGSYPDVYAETQDSLSAIIGSIINLAIFFAALNIFLIPFYVGLYKYKKGADSFTIVEKPYWKTLSLILITLAAIPFVFSFVKFSHFVSYNFFDYISIFSSLYEILLIIGFAWNIKFLNRLFWQITAVPYLLLTFMTYFFVSDTFNGDFYVKPTCFLDYVEIMIRYIIFIYMIYQYAFRKEAVKKKKKIKSARKSVQK